MHENKNVSLFDFNGHQVRVVDRDGEPWFVAVDACRALDMDVTRGAHRWLNSVGDTDRFTCRVRDIDPQFNRGSKKGSGRGGPSGATPITLVSESGLYKLVMRSDKPEAKAFQDWVTRTVLPAIRKDGGYVAGEEFVATGEMSEDELCDNLSVIVPTSERSFLRLQRPGLCAMQTIVQLPERNVSCRRQSNFLD